MPCCKSNYEQQRFNSLPTLNVKPSNGLMQKHMQHMKNRAQLRNSGPNNHTTQLFFDNSIAGGGGIRTFFIGNRSFID